VRQIFFVLGIAAITLISVASPVESQGKKKKDNTPAWSDNKDNFGDPLPIGAIARIGTVRYRTSGGHMNFQPVLSPDGKSLAMSGVNDEIEIIELPAWKKTRTIRGRDFEKKNTPYFQNVVFSQDSKKIVGIDSNSPQIYLIDIASGKLIKKIRQNEKQRANLPFFVLSSDEKTLIFNISNNKGNVATNEFQVWDLEQNKMLHSIEVPMNNFDGRATIPTITADGRTMVVPVTLQNPNPRNADRVQTHLEFWDLTTGKSIRKIEMETPMVFTAIAPNGKWLAASNGQSVLRFYDIKKGEEIHNIRMRRAAVSHITFSPDSSALYVADHSGTIVRYDPVRGEHIGETKAPVNMASVRQIAFAPDGKAYAMAQYADAIHYWEVASGKLLSPTGVPATMIEALTFSAQGDLFVASEEGHAAWWNPRTATKVRDLKLEFAPDNSLNDIIFDGPGPGIARAPYRRDNIGRLKMSPNANFITVGEAGAVSIYDAKTCKLLYDDDARNGRVGGLAFIDGGEKLASIQQKKVRVWNTRTGRDVNAFEAPIRDMEFPMRMTASSKGNYFAFSTGNDQGMGRVLLWDVAKKELTREWPTQDRGDALRFSPDDQWLAVGALQDQVRLTNVSRPRADYTLQLGKRIDEVTQLAFSPDSRQLACATIYVNRNSDSGRLVIFEVASKKIRLEYSGHINGIIDRLAYSHDGSLLASGASDTTALIWRAGLRAYMDNAAAKELTPDELDEHFKQLAGTNATTAFQHMIKLVQTPSQAVKLLGEKIAPAERVVSGEKTVPQWINDLASSQFVVRNRANATLIKIGASIEPDLKNALEKARDVETKRRIESLLEHFAAHEWSTEEVRHARAVEIIEAVGTAEARAALTRWAGGDSGAILTKQARVSLAQLP
jgi:WD40 repeat protein